MKEEMHFGGDWIIWDTINRDMFAHNTSCGSYDTRYPEFLYSGKHARMKSAKPPLPTTTKRPKRSVGIGMEANAVSSTSKNMRRLISQTMSVWKITSIMPEEFSQSMICMESCIQ